MQNWMNNIYLLGEVATSLSLSFLIWQMIKQHHSPKTALRTESNNVSIKQHNTKGHSAIFPSSLSLCFFSLFPSFFPFNFLSRFSFYVLCVFRIIFYLLKGHKVNKCFWNWIGSNWIQIFTGKKEFPFPLVLLTHLALQEKKLAFGNTHLPQPQVRY